MKKITKKKERLMKNWVKKFLNKEVVEIQGKDYTNDNSKKAFEKIGLPQSLYMDFSNKYKITEMFRRMEGEDVMNFLAGVCCGWAEGNKKIK
jgi:hypothetical protein